MPRRRGFVAVVSNLRAGGSFYLLAALLLMFVLIPFLRSSTLGGLLPESRGVVGTVILHLAVDAILITAAVTVAHARQPWQMAALLVVVPATIEALTWTALDVPVSLLAFGRIYTGVGLLFVVYKGLVAMFGRRTVTADTICLSLCAYVLLGLAWFYLYRAILLIEPGSFGNLDRAADRGDNADDLFYYSYVTLTTLGFGDITPKTSVARSLTIVEAIVGQMFVAVVLARLVGMHIVAATTGQIRGGDAD